METAQHSTGYWEKFLKQGNALFRFDASGVAFDRAQTILAAGNISYVQHDDQ